MQHAFAMLEVLCYLAAIFYVLLYRKNGARHRHHISFAAWIVLVVLAGSVVDVIVFQRAAGFFDTARAFVMALVVISYRGNVAYLFGKERT